MKPTLESLMHQEATRQQPTLESLLHQDATRQALLVPQVAPKHAWALESKMKAEQVRERQQKWAEEMQNQYSRDDKGVPTTPSKKVDEVQSRSSGSDAFERLLGLMNQASHQTAQLHATSSVDSQQGMATTPRRGVQAGHEQTSTPNAKVNVAELFKTPTKVNEKSARGRGRQSKADTWLPWDNMTPSKNDVKAEKENSPPKARNVPTWRIVEASRTSSRNDPQWQSRQRTTPSKAKKVDWW